MQQFPEELAQSLASLVGAYNGRRDTILQIKGQNLEEMELKILEELRMGDAQQKMKEVGEACNIKLSTLTGKVDSLEHLKLVRRTHDKADRRVIYLSLTKKGIELMQQLESIWESTVQGILKSHSVEEAELLIQALQSAVTSLSDSE